MTFYIDAVRLVDSPDGSHPHIGYVRLTNGQTLSRADVINNILYERNVFYTYASGVAGAKVVVADCPRCGSGDYITTEPDYTEENNLLDLPRF